MEESISIDQFQFGNDNDAKPLKVWHQKLVDSLQQCFPSAILVHTGARMKKISINENDIDVYVIFQESSVSEAKSHIKKFQSVFDTMGVYIRSGRSSSFLAQHANKPYSIAVSARYSSEDPHAYLSYNRNLKRFQTCDEDENAFISLILANPCSLSVFQFLKTTHNSSINFKKFTSLSIQAQTSEEYLDQWFSKFNSD